MAEATTYTLEGVAREYTAKEVVQMHTALSRPGGKLILDAISKRCEHYVRQALLSGATEWDWHQAQAAEAIKVQFAEVIPSNLRVLAEEIQSKSESDE